MEVLSHLPAPFLPFGVQGVELSHYALVETVASMLCFLDKTRAWLDHRDITLGFLPLAHIFERYKIKINKYTTLKFTDF